MNTKTPTEDLGRLSPAAFCLAEKVPVYIVLDNVRSALNVGSIFRTADAFRCAGVLLCGITATPPHREINKTALGATETVHWEHHPSAMDALKQLKQQGIAAFAVEQTQHSIPMQVAGTQITYPIALVLGNEVDGVSVELLQMCDGSIEIPQFGTKHSLNVAVCAGIVLWELAAKKLLTNPKR